MGGRETERAIDGHAAHPAAKDRNERRSIAFAMRRSLPSFEMLNPRNLRSSGRATALFVSLTFSRSFLVRNRLTEAITRSPARRLRT
jgi:hypothetical protein